MLTTWVILVHVLVASETERSCNLLEGIDQLQRADSDCTGCAGSGWGIQFSMRLAAIDARTLFSQAVALSDCFSRPTLTLSSGYPDVPRRLEPEGSGGKRTFIGTRFEPRQILGTERTASRRTKSYMISSS